MLQQKELNQAQIEYLNARTKRLEGGEGEVESLISITADGLEPELEMIMYSIIEKIQIRANEEGLEFLLGI